MPEKNATRKPHAGNAGYVCERKTRLGGHIVVYDRKNGFDCSADYRWIVMHEPSSLHVAVQTERQARQMMKDLAEARTLEAALEIADVFPRRATNELGRDDDGAVDAPKASRRRRQAAGPTDEQRAAALERFLADPENEPSAEGKAALRVAFDLDDE
jgi:hypothetical protein